MPLYRRAWDTLFRNPLLLLLPLGIYAAAFVAIFFGAVFFFFSHVLGILIGVGLLIWLGPQTQGAALASFAQAVKGNPLPNYWRTGLRYWGPTVLLQLLVGVVYGVITVILMLPVLGRLGAVIAGNHSQTALVSIGVSMLGSMGLLMLVLLALAPITASFQAALYMADQPNVGEALGAAFRTCFAEKRYFYWLGVPLFAGLAYFVAALVGMLFNFIPILGQLVNLCLIIAAIGYMYAYILTGWQATHEA